tara:strand:- start:7287 stop:8720 length:1434 start_codon:yes stop_codon:yes gene_type:complete
MDNIIYHKNHSSVTTYSTNLTQGCINPLRRTSYKRLINLSSRFRSDYSTTVSSDFFVDLAEPLKNVVSMNINSVNIPPCLYLVNEKTGSNNFIINFLFNSQIISGMKEVATDNDIIMYELPDEYNLLIKVKGGSYKGTDLAKQIKDKIYSNHNFQNYYSSSSAPFIKPVLRDNLVDVSYNSFNDKFIFDIDNDIWFTDDKSTFFKINGIKLDFTYQNPIDIKGTSIPDDSILQPISKEEYCKNYAIYNEISSNIDKNQLTLGWILGFRGEYIYNSPLDASFSSLNCNNKKQFQDCSTRSLTRNELKQLINSKSTNRNYIKTGKNGLKYLNELIPEERLETIKPISAFYVTKNNSVNNKFIIVSSSLYSLVPNNYLLLSVNDFQNNHNSSFSSLYEQSSLQDNNLMAKILDPSSPFFLTSQYYFKESNCSISASERIYFGPTKINRLQIKLLDMFGRIVDLNNSDWSLVLEVELLYDL